MEYNVPDVVGEPLTGWRCWFVVPENGHNGRTLLRSYAYNSVWEPNEIQEAECRSHSPQRIGHAPPADDCRCGIYAHEERNHVRTEYLEGPYRAGSYREIYRVIGEVGLWGKVAEGERGVRGQYAYPLNIQVPREIKGLEFSLSVSEIALALEVYGVPVEITDETILPYWLR